MAIDGTSQHSQFNQVIWPHLRQVIKQSLYWFCIVGVALIFTACTIENDDATDSETAPTNLTFEVLFATGMSAAQIADLLLEVWIHDLDDSAFDNGESR